MNKAICSICGELKPVCCNDGFDENENDIDPVCPDCCTCRLLKHKPYDGKSAGGGYYIRCD